MLPLDSILSAKQMHLKKKNSSEHQQFYKKEKLNGTTQLHNFMVITWRIVKVSFLRYTSLQTHFRYFMSTI